MYAIQELGRLRVLSIGTLTERKWKIVAAAFLHAWGLGAHRRSIDKTARAPLMNWLKIYFSDDTARRIAAAVWKQVPELCSLIINAQQGGTPEESIQALAEGLKVHFGGNIVALYQPEKIHSD